MILNGVARRQCYFLVVDRKRLPPIVHPPRGYSHAWMTRASGATLQPEKQNVPKMRSKSTLGPLPKAAGSIRRRRSPNASRRQVRYWPISEVTPRLLDGRFVGHSGLYLLALSSSHFDPRSQTAVARLRCPCCLMVQRNARENRHAGTFSYQKLNGILRATCSISGMRVARFNLSLSRLHFVDEQCNNATRERRR